MNLPIETPEPFDLFEFFGVDATLADEGVPWTYNEVSFSATLKSGSVRVKFAPSYQTCSIEVVRLPDVSLRLALESVISIGIDNSGPEPSLVVRDGFGLVVTLELRPAISVVVCRERGSPKYGGVRSG